ncbi:oxidoreductase [Aspergillus terreus]|uniref:Oxidoreductase n=1 Tax=Aspergillus terreus TaxID=33178 RepID=A0A5M3YXT2_ASPTE|nr:hypothetical protein ATETN484_0005076800 [Aspergillus terreus]GFF17420.1 oxidoreductase [Aspergillus terreus]
MSPIRVGLIGLSGAPSDQYEGTSWAASAHLPFLTASPHFEIVALLNSSSESARAAIAKYNLPVETKAYGDPADLANDPDVDLVVCCVRVDRHLLTVRPSLIAGKTVYVEWPLDRDLATAKEMASLANEHNARTIVGLQSNFSPLLRKMRSLVEGGEIGRILSSTFIGSFGNNIDTESKNVRYFLDRSVGGSVMSIHVGHSLESIITVLSQFKSFKSSSAITRPELDIVDHQAGGTIVQKAVPNTVPDNILLYGSVGPSDAPVTVKLYAGKEFPGLPRLDWQIQGTKGWLRLTSPVLFLNVGDSGAKVEIFRSDTGEVEQVKADSDEWDSFPIPVQNIARLYGAYRLGDWYPTFDWALKRHEMIDTIWTEFDSDRREPHTIDG